MRRVRTAMPLWTFAHYHQRDLSEGALVTVGIVGAISEALAASLRRLERLCRLEGSPNRHQCLEVDGGG